jgi:hypothetical protein
VCECPGVELVLFLACTLPFIVQGGTDMAVGTLAGGPNDVLLNNILLRSLWRYGGRRSHPGIFLPRLHGFSDRYGLPRLVSRRL